MPVSPSDLAVAHSRDTVWATDFPVWATEKTVAQTVELPLGHEKRAPQRPFSSFALQRYNKTRRKANRRRRTQNGKIRKKRKMAAGSSAMSIDVALSSCRGASRDAYFVGVLIGVAPDVATSTESHVNGHGSTIGARHDTKS